MNARGQTTLPQHGLEAGDLVQARSLLDHILETLLLLLREFDPRHPRRQSTARGSRTRRIAGRRRRVERLRLDAHDLGRQLCRLVRRAEELLCPLPLRVLHFRVV